MLVSNIFITIIERSSIFELSIDPNLPYWYELKNGKYVGMEKIKEEKDYDVIPKS